MRSRGKLIKWAMALCALVICSEAFAQRESTRKTDVISVSLVKVDYFEAEIALEFQLSDDIKSANIGYDIPEISTGYAPLRVRNGLNRLKLYVHRNINKFGGVETSYIQISAYSNGSTFYKKNIPLVINWPGPDYAESVIGSSPIRKVGLSGIDRIRVNRNLSYSEKFIESLLINGFPIEKVEVFRPAYGEASNNLVLSRYLNVEAAKNILQIFAASGETRPLIRFDDAGGRHKSGEVYVGSGAFIPQDYLVSDQDFERLKAPDLSSEEMMSLFGLKEPDSGEIAKSMYEEARDLIDAGRKNNIQRAKAILDELVNINPDYHPAYLELARYHMKMSWPAGLKKAERLILIARDIEPDYADTHVLLGYVYTNMGRYKQAHDEYVLAEKLGTDNLWLYANWGLNYEKQSMEKEAIEKYLTAINYPKLTEDNKRPRSWIFSKSKLFDFLVARKDFKKADELYGLSAEQLYYHKCDLQKQAALRAFQMDWYEGAIESYIKSKKSGCKESSSVLSIAYYMKWFQAKSNGNGSEASEVAGNLRRAEAAATSDGELFFGLSASTKTARLIPEMIDLGKNINYISADGTSALLQAVKENDLPRARRLLHYGADVNIKSVNNYFRPIVYATYLKNIDMVRLLLDFNAETYIELEEGLYLDDFARSLGQTEIAELLAVKISS